MTGVDLAGHAAWREHEVFEAGHVRAWPEWQRCQHGKRCVVVRAHWAETAPWRQGPYAASNSGWFERVVHADGTAALDAEGEVSTFEYGQHSQCRACKAIDTLVLRQEAYGDRTTCSACGHETWYSIGD